MNNQENSQAGSDTVLIIERIKAAELQLLAIIESNLESKTED